MRGAHEGESGKGRRKGRRGAGEGRMRRGGHEVDTRREGGARKIAEKRLEGEEETREEGGMG